MIIHNSQLTIHKVRASERESSLIELLQRAQPKLSEANSQLTITYRIEVIVNVIVGSELRSRCHATPKINFCHLKNASFARVNPIITLRDLFKKGRIHRGYGLLFSVCHTGFAFYKIDWIKTPNISSLWRMYITYNLYTAELQQNR